MKLAAPLGFLGLLSIIGLILIYILKPKYQDKKVSSTYIWKLSLKYAKRKVPWQWLKSSLLFIIQLFIFVAFAFMLTRPNVVLASTHGEKIIVLDASASMTAETSETSPFERSKKEIASLADATIGSGNKFTVIIAADEASFAVRRTDSAGFVRQKLSEVDCTLTEPNITAAMELAEVVLVENPYAEVHLYTDHDYDDSGKVTVHNMSKNEWNVAILDLTAKRVDGKYVFTAEIASYGQSSEFSVGLNVDGKAQVPKLASCSANGTVKVVWDNLNVTGYENAKVSLQGVTDTFSYDNDFQLFNSNTERFQVQLVSDDPGFLLRSLQAVGTCDVIVVNESTPAQTSGFDLYVYDGYLPEDRPTDGTVWLVNPPFDEVEYSGALLKDWGLSFNSRRVGKFNLSSSGGTSETYKTIMRSVSLSNVLVTEFSEIETFDGYETIMLCDGNPILLAKNDDGLKTVVLGFDIHKSDIAINPYFPILVKNICTYALTPTVAGTIYTAGDTVRINARANAVSMTVKAVYANGTEEEKQISAYSIDLESLAPGSYTVTQVLSSGRIVTNNFFVRISQGESAFGRTEAILKNPVVFTDGVENTDSKDTKEIYIYLAAAMLVIVCIEWGLQYREQF
ncbi:MAG: VWA domain-containing protein [Clostridiales bacterium]|nr:VWA domain-containing protein [Clostridiales bacterium]